MWTNFHSHSAYSDGKEKLETFVKSAIEKGLIAYGFSEHAPVNFDCNWTMPQEDWIAYSQEIDYLKYEYQNKIELYKGLEIDFVPGNTLSYRKNIDFLNLDFFIGAVHFVDSFENNYPWGIDTSEELFQKGLKEVFNDNIQHAVTRYYELVIQMIEAMNPPIIAHLDKIAMYNINNKYFDKNAVWYKKIVSNTLDYIAKTGGILEINTRGFYKGNDSGFCPAPDVLYECRKKNIPIMINSDCHEPHQIILGFEKAANLLLQSGYKTVKVLKNSKYSDFEFDSSGIKF